MTVCNFKHCDNSFEDRSNKKYCSRRCKQYEKDRRTGRNTSKSKKRKRTYSKHKKSYCENCNFVAIHSCQLDVDHIDGNHKNNELDNLQTLCANCHRLKTFLNKDWESK